MPEEELTDVGRLIIVREGEPVTQGVLGNERERALEGYLLGRPLPDYEYYLGGDGGGVYVKLDPQQPPKLRQDVLEYYQNERGWDVVGGSSSEFNEGCS